ncbi:MAG: ABC transporter permease [Devosia sp.]
MSALAPAGVETTAPTKPRVRRRLLPGAGFGEWFSFIFLGIIVAGAVFADWIPGLVRPNLLYANFSQPPDFTVSGILGTDALGRSILSRILHGARTSLTIAVCATAIALSCGIVLGMVAGYYRGIVERTVDLYSTALGVIPTIFLLLALISVLGSSVFTITIALGIFEMAAYARMVKAGVISQNERDYVLAARSMGARDLRILFREILPNTLPALLVVVPASMAQVIISEGGLSFLGYGIPAPAASWGSMIAGSTELIARFPLLIFGPILSIVLTVYSLNTIGDYLGRRMNSRERHL